MSASLSALTITALHSDPEQFLRTLVAKHTAARLLLLSKVIPELEHRKLHKVLNNKIVKHVLVLLAAPVIIACIETKTRSLSLFSFHPILLSLALPFLIHALTLKKDDILLKLFQDLMRGTTEYKARILHISLSLVSLVLTTGGIFFILAHKIANGKSIIPQSIHSLFSLLTIFSFLLQAYTGARKLTASTATPPTRVFRYHGAHGMITFDLFTISLLTGILTFLPWFSLPCLLSLITLLSLYFIVAVLIHAEELNRDEEEYHDAEQGVELLMREEEGEGGSAGGRASRTIL